MSEDRTGRTSPNDPESMTFERPPPYYEVWQERQGIPVYRTFHVQDLAGLELAPWDLFGGEAAFVNLTDCFHVGAMVLEIPPGGALREIHHMCEATVYVVDGRGETEVAQRGSPPRTVRWQRRSLFAPPLNTRYRHSNLDPDRPARLLVVNNLPLIMSLFHDEEFVFGADYTFDKRYRGEEDFFSGVPEYLGSRLSRVNFIPDVLDYELFDWSYRGKGARTAFMSLSDNTMAAHISSFPVGTYKKAHRHGAGAHVVVLSGCGYSLLWKEGDERTRVDWQPGTMFAPPEWWYHQHFNTGPEPARYLAIRNNNKVHPLRLGLPRLDDGTTQFGQNQIEFEDEDPAIYDDYAAELARNGVEIRLPRPDYGKGSGDGG